MIIMEWREAMLRSTMAGYEVSGVPMVSVIVSGRGAVFEPAGPGDDPGLYYFLPQVARGLGLGVHTALDVFYFSLLAVAALSAFVALCGCFRRWEARLLAAAGIVGVVRHIVYFADIYLIAPILALGLLPWGVFFVASGRWRIPFLVFGSSAGLLIGYGNLTRGHAGTGTLIFLIVLALGARRRSWFERSAFLGLLLAGLAASQAHFAALFQERDRFLASPASRPLALPPHLTVKTVPGADRPVWHCIYIGFGFMHNSYGIRYEDSCGEQKVLQCRPGTTYFSKEYEQTLKEEVFRLWQKDPTFVNSTLAAKCGVLVYYLLRAGGLGLLAAVFVPAVLTIDLGFLLAAAFYALPGLLVMPFEWYVLGLLATAAVYTTCKLAALTELLACQPCILPMCWSMLARLTLASGLLFLMHTEFIEIRSAVRSTAHESYRRDVEQPPPQRGLEPTLQKA